MPNSLLRAVATAVVLAMTFGVTAAQEATSVDNVQGDVVSASDDVSLALTYEFVNFVSVGSDVTEQLFIQGADTFDVADGGTIEYSFASETTGLYAEIVSVNDVSPTNVATELGEWYQDADNHLEFGIVRSDVSDRTDFNDNAQGSNSVARLFPDDSGGTVKAFLDGPGTYVGSSSSSDGLEGTTGGGYNSFEYAYYIAQRGDGPAATFGDNANNTTNGDSVTVQFTVAEQ